VKTYRVMTADQAQRLVRNLAGLPLPFTVTVTEGEIKRTTAQNALIHQWFGQIAKHRGDCTMLDVKGECHHRWGLPIKMRYVQFAWIWERTGAHLDYEKQCAFLACPEIKVSSAMTVKELSEYMDAMQAHYRGSS
jgi:hypothetical protein